MVGLEPTRLAPLPPQDSVSTSSTTSALIKSLIARPGRRSLWLSGRRRLLRARRLVPGRRLRRQRRRRIEVLRLARHRARRSGRRGSLEQARRLLLLRREERKRQARDEE